MYYAHQLFSKKGLLAKIWLSGTIGKKLTRAQVLSSDIVRMCEDINSPPVPLALPTQSTLLRGVVRIENRKTKYLYDDAIQARSNVRGAIKSTQLTLTKEKSRAKFESITYAADVDGKQQGERYDDIFDIGNIGLVSGDIFDDMLLSVSNQSNDFNLFTQQSQYTATQSDISLQSFVDDSVSPRKYFTRRTKDDDVLDGDFSDLGDIDFDLDMNEFSTSNRTINDNINNSNDNNESLIIFDDSIRKEQQQPKGTGRKRQREILEESFELSDDEIMINLRNINFQTRTRPSTITRSKIDMNINDDIMNSYPFATINNNLIQLLTDHCHIISSNQPEFKIDQNLFDMDMDMDDVDVEYARNISLSREREQEGVSLLQKEYDIARLVSSRRTSVGNVSNVSFESFEDNDNDDNDDNLRLLANNSTNISQFSQRMSEDSKRIHTIQQRTRQNFHKQKNDITIVFCNILKEAFDKASKTGTGHNVIDFEVTLSDYAGGNLQKRDVAMSFQELLLLMSLGEIEANQPRSYGKLYLEKGRHWEI